MPALNDHQLAAEIARAAGQLLMAVRSSALLRGDALGDAGDALANGLILRMLKAARPLDAFLSEETAPDAGRLIQKRVWVIDPLDGTREYSQAEPGQALATRDDWAVHVALSIRGRPEFAAVALPAQGVVLSSAEPPVLAPAPEGPLRILVSRTRAPRIAEQVAKRLGAELVPMGSAGAKAMAVVQGRAHAYMHAGGLSEWDSCAPVGVALAAGLHASRIDGSPCVYNQPQVSMPDLLVCRPEWAERLLAAIAASA